MQISACRILVVHNAYQHRGGEDSTVEAEAALLRAHGHEVEEYRRHNDEIEGMPRWGLAMDTLWSRRTAREVDELIESFRPDVIHAHNTFPLISPSLYWAAGKRSIPVVQTLHNFRLLCPQAMFLRNERVCEDCLGRTPWRGVVHGCYRGSRAQSGVLAAMLGIHRVLGTWKNKVTRYIALNEFCRRKFIEGGLPAEKIAVKPNFVDWSLDACPHPSVVLHSVRNIYTMCPEPCRSGFSPTCRPEGRPTTGSGHVPVIVKHYTSPPNGRGVVKAALSPTPLPQAGEGNHCPLSQGERVGERDLGRGEVKISTGGEGERKGGLFVGRLSPEKGTRVLAEAVGLLGGVALDVIGTGPEQATLQGCPNLRLLGWRELPEILVRMRQSAYLVMPSVWYENFPRTLVEAFACGLPVIASRLGAMAELIEDGRTGLLFEAGSAFDLAQKIRWAEANPAAMRRMGEAARAEYAAKYTPERNYAMLMEIYRDVIREGTGG